MCLACFSSPAEFLNYWMVKGVKFLSRLLNASCSDVITVPLFFSLPPIRPRPLSSFNTYASWQPVTESARSRWSYGKIEDCEQSILKQIKAGTLGLITFISIFMVKFKSIIHIFCEIRLNPFWKSFNFKQQKSSSVILQ